VSGGAKLPGRLFGGALLLAAILYATALHLRKPASTPFLRGQRLAQSHGCFACHGAGGLSGIPNPGGDEAIPAWSGGTAMMYLEKDEHIREFIRLGKRKDQLDEKESALISMPAYGKSLNPKQVEDLTAYVKGVSEFYPGMPDTVKKGLAAARDAGCLGCHGPSGRGGVRNPGSFKGVIPGWDDPGLADLTRNDAETEEWIRTGTLKRMEKNPMARHFLRRQTVKMPAYDTLITPERIRSLEAYINWVRS
jgi:mono/diheme cytochrome c family protein